MSNETPVVFCSIQNSAASWNGDDNPSFVQWTSGETTAIPTHHRPSIHHIVANPITGEGDCRKGDQFHHWIGGTTTGVPRIPPFVDFNVFPNEHMASALAKNIDSFNELAILIKEAAREHPNNTWVRILIPDCPLKFDVKFSEESNALAPKKIMHFNMQTHFDLRTYEQHGKNGCLDLIGDDQAMWSFGFDIMDFGVTFDSDPMELAGKGTFADFKKDIAILSRWGVKALVHPNWRKFTKQDPA